MAQSRRDFIWFLASEQGSTSVAFAIWMPFLFGLIVMITDISIALFNRGNVERIVQDANRLRATGMLTSNAMTEAYLHARLTQPDGTVAGTAHSAVILLTATSVVDIPLSQLASFGVLPKLVGDINIRIRNQQALEFMEI